MNFHLSASSINTYLRCPRQWEARYLRDIREPSNAAMLKGTAIDRLASRNWEQRIRSGRDWNSNDAVEIARNELADAIDKAGGTSSIEWGEDDRAVTPVEAAESVSRMATVFITELAPLAAPEAVQQRFELPTTLGVNVLGYIDAIETAKSRVIDVKTGNRAMAQVDADRDVQASAYAWATGLEQVDLFRVIDTPKGKVTKSEVITTIRRAEANREWFETLAEGVQLGIDHGVFPPSPGWQCDHCPIRKSCIGGLS